MTVLEHQRDRQIGPREGHQEHGEGNQGQPALQDRDAPHGPPEFEVGAQREDHQQQLQRRKPRREPQRRKAGLGDHDGPNRLSP